MTFAETYLLTLKTRVENLKRDVWLWSRAPTRSPYCSERGYKSLC